MMDAMPAAPTAPPPPPAAVPALSGATAGGAAARRTARDFEAVFIGEMTKLMMDSVPADGGFTGGHGEEMFRGVLAEKLGGEIARRGGVGIAPAVLGQIIKLQGGEGGGR